MILLTVGTQLPFDRLVARVDAWATENTTEPVRAQIGPSSYEPRALDCFDLIGPEEFRELQRTARVIIAHAGMGSIITALEFGVPIIIMPRSARLGEHRNDHQAATAKRFMGTPGVYVVQDEAELVVQLARLDELVSAKGAPSQASSELINGLRGFFDTIPRRTATLRRR